MAEKIDIKFKIEKGTLKCEDKEYENKLEFVVKCKHLLLDNDYHPFDRNRNRN